MHTHRWLPSLFVLAAVLPAQAAPVEKPQDPIAPRAAVSAPARVLMGVTMNSVDEALADQLGVAEDDVVLIESVMPGYGAQKAGIKAHDVITEIDGKSPVTMDRVREVLKGKKPGDKVRVKVARAKGEKEFTVELMAEGATAGPVAGAMPAPAPDQPRAGASGGGAKTAPAAPRTTEWSTDWLKASRTLAGAAGIDGEKLERQLDEARRHIAEAQQLLGKQSNDLARHYAKMAEELASKARAKSDDALDQKRFAEMHSLIDKHAKDARDRYESELKPKMDAHMKALEQLLQDYHKQGLPGFYTSRDGKDKAVVVPQGSGSAGQRASLPRVEYPPSTPSTPNTWSTPAQPYAVAQPYPAAQGLSALGAIPTKSLDKVQDRLAAVEKRLERIESLLESLVDGDKRKRDR